MFLWIKIKPYILEFFFNKYDFYNYFKYVVDILEINKYSCPNLKTAKKCT